MSCPETIALNHASVPLYFKPKSFTDMSEEYRLQPKKDCNICNACLEKRVVKEHTPLLATNAYPITKKTKCYDNILVVLLTVMLVFSLFIVIVIYVQEDEPHIIEEFDYVPKDDWSMNGNYIENVPKMRLPVSRISLQTLTAVCNSDNGTCSNYEALEEKGKKKIKIKGAVLYNFYQKEDGKIYEGRGWGYQSTCEDQTACNNTATIALIESGTNSPFYMRELKLRAFLKFSISNNALTPCFHLIVKRPDDQYVCDIATALNNSMRADNLCKYA